jgi:hypothetical protein
MAWVSVGSLSGRWLTLLISPFSGANEVVEKFSGVNEVVEKLSPLT